MNSGFVVIKIPESCESITALNPRPICLFFFPFLLFFFPFLDFLSFLSSNKKERKIFFSLLYFHLLSSSFLALLFPYSPSSSFSSFLSFHLFPFLPFLSSPPLSFLSSFQWNPARAYKEIPSTGNSNFHRKKHFQSYFYVTPPVLWTARWKVTSLILSLLTSVHVYKTGSIVSKIITVALFEKN